ncbi:MAG: hypothetical protein ACI4I7_03130 [Oscillospiraceae bacterium]
MRDNVEIMTDVFQKAMTFEKYVDIWSNSLNYVNCLLSNNKRNETDVKNQIENEQAYLESIDQAYANNFKRAKKDKNKHKLISLTVVVLVAICLLLGVILLKTGNEVAGIMLTLPFTGIGSLVIIGVVVYNLFLAYSDKKEMKKHINPVKEHKRTVIINNIKAQNLYIDKLNTERKNLLIKSNAIFDGYTKAKKVLDEIYSYNLIPEKYRGLIPTATIYGYLINGRCTIICGHGGVYDTYEKDLQHGEIISNLKDISRKMDIIIRNQQKLYELVKSIDSTLYDIKSEVKNIGEISSRIETNSAIANTYLQQSAAANSYVASAVWRNN